MAELMKTLYDLTWDREGWEAPLADALKGLTAREAAWRPAGAGNTIWQTLNHMNHYDERTLAELTGGTPPPRAADNDATFGAPGDPADESGWQVAVERRRRIGEGLAAAIASLPEAKAGELAAQILHAAYHTGQIVQVRKEQGSWPARR